MDNIPQHHSRFLKELTLFCYLNLLYQKFYFFFACSRHGLALSLDSILGSQILFNQIF